MTGGAHPGAPIPDPVGLAATAVASAVSAGLAVVTASVFGVKAMQSPGAGTPDFGLPFVLLLVGTASGILLAGVVAWYLLAPIGSTYRRGGLAVVSAFATVPLMLLCMPVGLWLRQPGLAGMFALCVAAALLLGRHARRLAWA